MRTILLVTTVVGFALMNSGCCSYLALEDSKKEVTVKRAIVSGNESAIKAAKLGENGAGIGIDVTNLEAIKDHPIKQLLAAVADAGLIYGGSKLAENINASSSKAEDRNNSVNVQNSRDVQINITQNRSDSISTSSASTDNAIHGNGNSQ